MTLITCLEIANNYPENIRINSTKQTNGKFSAVCYRLKDGEIHKLILSTQPIFGTEEEANNSLHTIANMCKNKYK